MKGKFEKNIQQQFGNFRIDPSDEVWNEIERSLRPRRKRRIVFWWWTTATGFIIAGLVLWHFYYNKPSSQNKTAVDNISNNVIKDHSGLPGTKKDSVQKIITGNSTEKKIEKNGYVDMIPGTITTFGKNKKPGKRNYLSGIDEKLNKEKRTTFNEGNQNNNNDEIDIPNVISKRENANIVSDLAGNATPQNKINMRAINSNPFPLLPDKTKISAATHSKKNKLHQWLIAAEGGWLNTVKNIFNLQNVLAPRAYTNVTGYPGSSSSYISNAKTGFVLALGIHRQMELAKHWSFETGFMYRYFQNKQPVGSKKDSLLGYANYYYQPGNANTITNYIDEIEVPLLFNYILNPKKKNEIYLQAGAAAQYILVKKWLIADNNLNGHYYNARAIKNFQLSASVGIGIDFHNSIQAVIKMQPEVTPLYRVNKKRNYTNQISLGVFIPLRKKNN